ncbi:hypothetical protein PF005_g3686, partial [Phytophthora fragariae]
ASNEAVSQNNAAVGLPCYTLLASVNAFENSKNSVGALNVDGPSVGERRFLRGKVIKNDDLALSEERAQPVVTKMKAKLFKLKMKIAMPGIKKVLQNVVEGLLK